MKIKLNPTYQRLIDIIEGVLASSVFSQEMKYRLQTVIDKLTVIGAQIELNDDELCDNVQQFKNIVETVTETYIAKNHDYGNSFEQSLDKFGLIAAIVRMGDKMNRIESLSKKEAEVKGESIKDTLLDLASYSIMTLMWLNKNNKEET